MVEEFLKNLEDIEGEINKIFYDVVDKKDISVYKSELLRAKLEILKYTVDSNITKLFQREDKELRKNTKKIKIVAGISITGLFLFSINPLLGFFVASICVLYMSKLIHHGLNIGHISSVEHNYIKDKLQTLAITFENCETFINARTNENIEYLEDELENEDLKKISFANQKLNIILMNDTYEEIDDDIKEMMVMMLQDTLGTDEDDFEKLIMMASEKITSDNLEKGECLMREKEDGKE